MDELDDLNTNEILQGVEDIMERIGWTAEWYTLKGQLIKIVFTPTKGKH